MLKKTNIVIDDTTPQMDSTDRLAVSLYGKRSVAGDTALLVDSAGFLAGGAQMQLLGQILSELRTMNLHLAAITGEHFAEG